MRKKLLIAIILSFPLLAVAQEMGSGAFTLKVHASKARNPKLYLLYQMEGKKIMDSAELSQGAYLFHGTIDQPRRATLVADSTSAGLGEILRKSPVQVKTFKLFLHAGYLELNVPVSLNKAEIISSSINKDYIKYEEIFTDLKENIMKVARRQKESKSETEKWKWKVISDSLNGEKNRLHKDFILKNPQSYVSLFAMEEYAGPSPKLSIIEPLFKSLSVEVRNTALAANMKRYWKVKEELLPGAYAPDFTQNNVSGKPIKLSDFKGKYVLIDFWASWCGPCREQNPKLVSIYQDFKDKNFTILGVSLDEKDGRSRWTEAIEKDNLTWNHVSDLKHWENEVAKLYGIRAIPQTYLISAAGKIIAKGLEPKQLRELLLKELK
ncbi:AhpC/TSA family protein [Desertivirga xinjiangensis]|uniref:AhpC/TSA family protein n=1 Tax=Desertivirga xinjiangensis TaxID=539206 RepID=UPI00210A9475|nr:AhpC/TSA family protein [Pedobacter xinjiangensis]